VEGEGLEGVAGEYSGGFAEEDVAGGLTAAEVVVMDEGVCVEHFDGGAEVSDAFGELAIAMQHATGFDGEDGSETLATGKDAMAHGAMNGVREDVGAGQEAFECGVSKCGAGVEQTFYICIHESTMISACLHGAGYEALPRKQKEGEEGDGGDGIADGLVRGAGVGNVDAIGAGGDRDGEQTVLALVAGGDECSVEMNLPGGVVAEVENEDFWGDRAEIEVRGR
jgi:hypothetical protein